ANTLGGKNATAVGDQASASAADATAVGHNSLAEPSGTAVGAFVAAGLNSAAFGSHASAINDGATAIGAKTSADGASGNATAVGFSATATGTAGTTAIGANAQAGSTGASQ